MKIILFLSIFFVISFNCHSPSVQQSAFNNRADELKIISKNKNLSNDQRMIIQHASDELRNAGKIIKQQDKEIDKKEAKLIKKSNLAGAGKLIYVILGIIGLGIIAFIIYKIKSFIR